MRYEDLNRFICRDGATAMHFLLWKRLINTPRFCPMCKAIDPTFNCYMDKRNGVPYFMCSEKVGELVIETTDKGRKKKTGHTGDTRAS